MFEALATAVGPADLDGIDRRGLAEPEGDREFGLGEITPSRHDLAGLGDAAGSELNPGSDGVAIGGRAAELESGPAMAGGLVVAQEERGSVGLNQEGVEIAVSIDIGIGRASADERLEEVGAG